MPEPRTQGDRPPPCSLRPSGRLGAGAGAGTFLPGGVIRVQTPGHRDHLEDQVIPSLADHGHDLPVANLDDVLVVHLPGEEAGGEPSGGVAGGRAPWERGWSSGKLGSRGPGADQGCFLGVNVPAAAGGQDYLLGALSLRDVSPGSPRSSFWAASFAPKPSIGSLPGGPSTCMVRRERDTWLPCPSPGHPRSLRALPPSSSLVQRPEKTESLAGEVLRPMRHSVTRRDNRSRDPDPRVTRITLADTPSSRAPWPGALGAGHSLFMPSDPHPSLLGWCSRHEGTQDPRDVWWAGGA